MIIQEGIIHGFGLFHEEKLPPLADGLVVFQGDNEAGKSTFLSFIRQMLFGFPRKNAPDFMEVIHGEKMSGLLWLKSTSGDGYLLQRFKERASVIFRHEDGSELGEGELARLLSGTSETAFSHLFAFSLVELQSMDELQGEDVAVLLYGASLGASAIALPRIRKELSCLQEELFKPRGQKQVINALSRRIEKIRSDLVEARRGLDQYENSVRDRLEKESAITETKEKLMEMATEESRLRNTLDYWKTWIQFQENENRLSQLSQWTGHSYVSRKDDVETIQRDLKQLSTDGEESSQVIEQTENKLSALDVDDALLERRKEIIALRNGLETYIEKSNKIPNLESEIPSNHQNPFYMSSGTVNSSPRKNPSFKAWERIGQRMISSVLTPAS